jgi:uncharacterized membrane protein
LAIQRLLKKVLLKGEKAFIPRYLSGKERKKHLTFDSSKNLGGIGALLIFISVFFGLLHPFIVAGICLVGMILILASLSGLAGYYSERKIFSEGLNAFVVGVVGMIVAAGVFIYGILTNWNNIRSLISTFFPGWNGDWTSLSGMTPNPNVDPQTVLPLLFGVFATAIIAFVILVVALIVASLILRRSLVQISAKSGIGLFGTAGILLLIGAFLTIIFIGIILVWIAALLLAIAFFTLKPQQPGQPQAATITQPPAPM